MTDGGRGRRAFAVALPLLYMVAIFVQSSSALPEVPGAPPQLDELAHLVEYAVLGALVARAIAVDPRLGPPGPRAIWAVATLIAVLYGLSDELHQSFVPARCASWTDALADAAGAAAGALVAVTRLARPAAGSRGGRGPA